MAYIDLAELKSHIGTDVATDDSILEECITEGQKWLESLCKRTFESSTGTRYYRPEDVITLPIGPQYNPIGQQAYTNSRHSWDIWPDSKNTNGSGINVLWLEKDLLSVSALTNGDGTTISSTGYWLEPRNAANDGEPYQYIRLRSSETWEFDTDGEVSVAGTWGYSTAPPKDIVRATKILATFLYRQRDSSVFDVTATPELGIITTPSGVPILVDQILKRGGYIKEMRIK